MTRFAAILAFAAALGLLAQSPENTQETIRAVKDFQETLGLGRTRNFEHATDKGAAASRCYYAPKLELPLSYDELRFENAGPKGCEIDETRFDVFYYLMEAVASGSSPVTSSLAASSTERMLVVVTHEDFHQHHEESKLPAAATEAASTLAGFLTAAEFARERYGDSEVARKLALESDLFLEKALVVNAQRERALRLYESHASGLVSREAALAQKARIFSELERACLGIPGVPSSFNKCPGAFNNAGLAFDYTYTEHYPLLHRLFTAHGRDARKTLDALRALLERRIKTEGEFVRAVNDAIASAR